MSQSTPSSAEPRRAFSPGVLLIWIAVLIYASSNSIVSLLADIGARHPIDGRNPITYCNLLFLGSFLSLFPMLYTFRKDWTRANLRALSGRDWTWLTVSAVLSSALTPGLFFYALEYTSVTNVVLVGRIEPPLFLLASVIFLREAFDRWAFIAGLVALCGAIVIISLKDGMLHFMFGGGEIAALLATLSFIASTLITRKALVAIPLGIFSVYRTVVGSFIYFWVAMILYGPNHFQDLLRPIVWQWVWIYAVVVILIGQFAWTLGLRRAKAGDIALATSFSPLAAILIAMLLLGENPGPGLIPGGLLILAGIAIGHSGRHFTARRAAAKAFAMEQESRINFKGS